MRQKEAKQLAQVECLSDRTEAIAGLAHQPKFSMVRSRIQVTQSLRLPQPNPLVTG